MKFTTTFSAIFVAMAGFAAAEEVAFGAADGSMFRAEVAKGQTLTDLPDTPVNQVWRVGATVKSCTFTGADGTTFETPNNDPVAVDPPQAIKSVFCE